MVSGAEEQRMADDDVALKLTRSFGEGLLFGIGGQIGGLIVREIFPDDNVPDYFAKVYEEIKTILDEELTKREITAAQDHISAVVLYMRDDYPSARASVATNAELFDNLGKKIEELEDDVISVLGDGKHNAGFSAYASAVGLKFSIYQEMAFVDPHYSDKPNQSAMLGALKAEAKDLPERGISMYDTILEKRGAQVKSSQVPGEESSRWGYEYQAIDAQHPDKVISRGVDRKAVEDDADKYREKVKKEVAERLADGKSALDSFKALNVNPFPKCPATGRAEPPPVSRTT